MDKNKGALVKILSRNESGFIYTVLCPGATNTV